MFQDNRVPWRWMDAGCSTDGLGLGKVDRREELPTPATGSFRRLLVIISAKGMYIYL
jgi:hypothetical protein